MEQLRIHPHRVFVSSWAEKITILENRLNGTQSGWPSRSGSPKICFHIRSTHVKNSLPRLYLKEIPFIELHFDIILFAQIKGMYFIKMPYSI